MAKKLPNALTELPPEASDFEDKAPGDEGPEEPVEVKPFEPDPALTAALAKIRELEASLSAERSKLPVASLAVPLPGHTGLYRVDLEHSPSLIVEAPDPANAYETYKRRMGIITTEHAPAVRVASQAEYEQLVIDHHDSPWNDKELRERLLEKRKKQAASAQE